MTVIVHDLSEFYHYVERSLAVSRPATKIDVSAVCLFLVCLHLEKSWGITATKISKTTEDFETLLTGVFKSPLSEVYTLHRSLVSAIGHGQDISIIVVGKDLIFST